MKAWSLTMDCGYIVFASTRSSAKQAGKGLAGFDWDADEYWVNVRVRRLPALDSTERGERETVDWAKEPRFYRDAGWFTLCAEDTRCVACELYEYADLPESEIQGNKGLCGECRALLDSMTVAINGVELDSDLNPK